MIVREFTVSTRVRRAYLMGAIVDIASQRDWAPGEQPVLRVIVAFGRTVWRESGGIARSSLLGVAYERCGSIALLRIGHLAVYRRVGDVRSFAPIIIPKRGGQHGV